MLPPPEGHDPYAYLFQAQPEDEMMVSDRDGKGGDLRVDLFIESAEQPEMIAKKCQRHAGVKFNLINISNRGTQVWPTGSVYTNLVNQYNVRFESLDGDPLHQQDILGLYVSLSGDFKILFVRTVGTCGATKRPILWHRASRIAQGRQDRARKAGQGSANPRFCPHLPYNDPLRPCYIPSLAPWHGISSCIAVARSFKTLPLYSVSSC